MSKVIYEYIESEYRVPQCEIDVDARSCRGATMLITNVLASNFSLPPNYTGLIISLLFGLIVFAATATEIWWLRMVLYLLNSLIIFSVALGANQAGVAKTQQTAPITFTQYSQMIKSAKTGALDAPFFFELVRWNRATSQRTSGFGSATQ
jgi:hypothetical protein